MNTRTLTSANSILLISVTPIFSSPTRLQGFAADDITDMDATQPAETSMGIDGRLSAGWVPTPVSQNITLQADSQSIDLFEYWNNWEREQKEKLVATGTLILPAVQKKYAMKRGFLFSVSPIPAARRTLQPRRFTIQWESVAPSPFI